jgi:2-oxoglutarate ferredoxin oxidoreductase subunit alpha
MVIHTWRQQNLKIASDVHLVALYALMDVLPFTRKRWRTSTMAEREVTLMKGNEAIANAAIRCGADAFFGYPITPQSEIIETLSLLKPWETTGMVVLQAESEVASINMVYGGAGAGKRVMTTSSSPGVALMQEGISYMAGSEIPGVIINVQRGGPGLGTIQPSQSDYFQATRGGGNGDYYVIVLAPNSVQEMADFVDLAFELAFKYRNPAMILSDGVIGQMMEKVVLPPYKARRTEEEIKKECPWATIGRTKGREPNILTSLELKPEIMEVRNLKLQEKYQRIKDTEVRYETQQLEDADYIIVSFGSAARIGEKAVELAREEGIKVGLFRPITLWPFPSKEIAEVAKGKKGILVSEINAGQMIEDVRLAVNGAIKVEHFGRLGGIVPEPEEIVKALKEKLG